MSRPRLSLELLPERVTPKQLALACGVNTSTVYRWIYAKKLQAVTVRRNRHVIARADAVRLAAEYGIADAGAT